MYFKWYGHVGLLVDNRLVKKIYGNIAERTRRISRVQKRCRVNCLEQEIFQMRLPEE